MSNEQGECEVCKNKITIKKSIESCQRCGTKNNFITEQQEKEYKDKGSFGKGIMLAGVIAKGLLAGFNSSIYKEDFEKDLKIKYNEWESSIEFMTNNQAIELSNLLDNNKKDTKHFIESLHDKILYLDSNIYMDERFEILFQYFTEYKLTIILLNEQYDEIYNIKKSTNEEKAFKARKAFKLIEEQLDCKNLTIIDLAIKPKDSAYADPALIIKIIETMKEANDTVFITEDMDLRIRLKNQILKQKVNEELISIYSHKDLVFLTNGKNEQELNKNHKNEFNNLNKFYEKKINEINENMKNAPYQT